MCGIAGIIDFTGRPVMQEELKKMTDSIAHRGPDGEGFFVEGNVGFGHRRLSIIDLSSAAAQPMTRFGLTITYNGEIYNYIELRKELERQEIVFTTQSDTEVILAAYHRWGKDCVQRFNGMWAFAIYDATNREVFLSRDRFGEKPLYYWLNNRSRLVFASEIRAIRCVVPALTINEQAVADFLVLDKAEFVATTFFQEVRKVPASASVTIQLDSALLAWKKYEQFQEQEPIVLQSPDESIAQLRHFVEASVHLRLRSDVPVGSCLSGGLDSSIICRTATQLLEQQGAKKTYAAFHAAAFSPAANEQKFAQLIADASHANLQIITPESPDFVSSFATVAKLQEEPFNSASIFMQFFVMQLASTNNIKVLLDGQGADELFLGYLHHLFWLMQQQSFSKCINSIQAAANNYNIRNSQLVAMYLYHKWPAVRQWRLHHRWKHLRTDLLQYTHKQIVNTLGASGVFQMQMAELKESRLPALLRYADKNAMHFSIESRMPYLDKDIVSLALQLPLHMKIHNGWSKYALRAAYDDMPPQITWRKGKIGFAAPDAAQQQLTQAGSKLVANSQLLKELFNNKPMPSDAVSRWRLTSVAAWEAFYINNHEQV